METITVLQSQVDVLKEVARERMELIQYLVEQRTSKLSKVISKYFDEVLQEGDTTELIRGYVYFNRLEEGSSYAREVLSLSFLGDSWGYTTVTKISTSFYSTISSSDLELNRMVLIGAVAKIIIDFKDDIIAEYNTIFSSCEGDISKAEEERDKVLKEAMDLGTTIDTLQKIATFKELEKGFEFKVDDTYRNNITLQPNYSERIHNISKVKLIDKTTSGKSANLEIVRYLFSGKEVIEIYNNVRISNVEKFINLHIDKRISVS
jgi:hypothetical protein